MLRKVFKKHKMSVTKNRKQFVKNQNRGVTEVFKPTNVDNAVMPATKIKERRFSHSGEKMIDTELVQRSRVALLGLKRSLICGSIVLVILFIVYFLMK